MVVWKGCVKRKQPILMRSIKELLEGMKANSTAVADLLRLDDSLQILLLLLYKNERVEWSFGVEKVEILQFEGLFWVCFVLTYLNSRWFTAELE